MKMLSRLVANATLLRQSVIRRLLDPRRDLYAECGYPNEVAIEDYKQQYDRGDIAARVVAAYPDDCWSQRPDVFETEDPDPTEFEMAWEKLDRTKKVYSHLQRVDVLSGIGRFGILLIGLDDGLSLERPAGGIDQNGNAAQNPKPRNITFLRALDESLVQVAEFESSINSPRFGLPTFYNIQISQDGGTSNVATRKVHWTRVLHVADNRTSSEVYGTPRMQNVFNRILDLEKISGGSAEMFWKGGFPGLSIETPPGDDDYEIDEDSTKEQVEAYMNGLQRYLATVGLTVKSLSPQIADPKTHMEVQLRLVAVAKGIPWRILVGAEVGQLASEQDVRNWNRRLERRRADYITPDIIRPFVDRLIALGVLPWTSEFTVEWPDLNTPSDEDKALVAERRSNALSKYVQSGSDIVIPPFHYLTLVLGLSEKEAVSVLKSANGAIDGDGDSVTEELRRQAAAEPAQAQAPSSSGQQ